MGLDDGDDVVIGDSGEIDFDTTTGAPLITEIRTINPANGPGDDFIFTDNGNDIVLAGSGNDVVDTENETNPDEGVDIVFGDNGTATFDLVDVGGGLTSVLTEIVSTATGIGGDDVIIVGDGDDVVIAGVGDDLVNYEIDPATGRPVQVGQDDGDDIVIGDNGYADFDTTTGAPLIVDIETTAPWHGGDDFIFTDNGNDIVLAGSGNDVVDAENETNPDEGVDIVLGDNGRIHFDLVDTGAGPQPVVQQITSTATQYGGDDTIIVGDGDDIVVAGTGNDLVNYEIDPATGQPVQVGDDDGDDVVIGDNGTATFETTTGRPLVDFISTTAPQHGGDDMIFTDDGADIVLAGTGNDVVVAQGGSGVDRVRDIVIGDNGFIDFDTSLGDSRILTLVTNAPALGGVDVITTGFGDDIVFGGSGQDRIHADGGYANDVIVGDNGEALWVNDVLTWITTTDPAHGGNDHIVTGSGLDVVLAGTGDDFVDAGTDVGGDIDRDIVVGDNGVALFNAFGQSTLVYTIDTLLGGNDFIMTGGGVDTVIGGSNSDFIQSGLGDDLVLGDNGRVEFVDSNGNAGIFQLAYSTHPVDGGHDHIQSGGGDDVVFGGSFLDTIYGGAGNDILLGDHGRFDRSLPRNQQFVSIMTGPDDFGGDDTIYGDNGPALGGLGFEEFDDIILGQQGDDRLFGELGDDDITGGHNVLHGADGDDEIDGGEGADVVLGDNGVILRTMVGFDPLQATAARYAEPFPDVIRSVTMFDNIDLVAGNDRILGGPGRDTIHGQRGDDRIDGQAGDDNILGELGSDVLFGGPGNDVVLAEAGRILPVFAADGTPYVQPDGSWRRDVVLEEQGVVVDYLNGGIDFSTAITGDLAARLMRADLVLIAGIAPSATLPWDTLLILIDFLAASTNEIDGGDGNDVLFGGSAADLILGADGNDQIFGGLGDDLLDGEKDDDLVVGDDVTNSALRAWLTRVLHGVRLTDDLTTLGLVRLSVGGTFVVPDGAIGAEAFVCAAPGVAAGASVGQVLTGAGDIGEDIVRRDGTVLETTLSVPGDVLNNPDRLPGNDVVRGGAGDDVLIGDDLDVWQDLPDIGPFNVLEARFQAEIDRLVRSFAQLAIDHDLAEATSGGVLRFQPGRRVFSGNDRLEGGRGEDLFTGDSAALRSAPGNAVFVDEASYVESAFALYQAMLDVEHVTADLADLVVGAHATVLRGMIADAISFGAPSGGSPVPHQLSQGNDLLDARATPLVFGDVDPDVLVRSDSAFGESADPIELTPAALAAIVASLDEADAVREPRHGPTPELPSASELSTIPFDRTCDPSAELDRVLMDPEDVLLNPPAAPITPSVLGPMAPSDEG